MHLSTRWLSNPAKVTVRGSEYLASFKSRKSGMPCAILAFNVALEMGIAVTDASCALSHIMMMLCSA
jgi:hypothetical protein